jgi:hypothetical protein
MIYSTRCISMMKKKRTTTKPVTTTASASPLGSLFLCSSLKSLLRASSSSYCIDGGSSCTPNHLHPILFLILIIIGGGPQHLLLSIPLLIGCPSPPLPLPPQFPSSLVVSTCRLSLAYTSLWKAESLSTLCPFCSADSKQPRACCSSEKARGSSPTAARQAA